MQRLNLCIDIDGTLTDPYYWLSRANKFFGKKIKPEEVLSYRMHEVLGIEEQEYERFYSFFGAMIHKEASARNGVCEVINELYKKHYVHFVTAREEKMRYVSLDWLRRHQIPFDSLSLLGSPDKVMKAEELDSDLFIEDSYDNAVQLADAGYDVLLIDCSYNQGPLPQNVKRVSNWYQIKNIILQRSEKEAS